MTTQVTHRSVETNGIRMHLAETGSGPLVLLCHGFPELWYSFTWSATWWGSSTRSAQSRR